MTAESGNIITDSEWNRLSSSEYDEKETDRILSEELLLLSFHERNNINEEIHGVRNAFPELKENSKSIESSLLDMESELESIILETNINCGLRLEHIPTNRELRLAFLRCELYDARKAAVRLVTYIRVIRDQCSCREERVTGCVAGCDCGSLGEENGGRIQASKWFTKKEYSALKKGVIQLMPYRDRSGRRVLIVFSACFQLSMVSRLKIILYLIAGASEDIESQKRGVVILVWPGISESMSQSSLGTFASIYTRQHIDFAFQMSLPLRIVCFHFGSTSSPLLRFARMMLVAVMLKQTRVRFNIITGTKTELNYKIMTFGIHPAMLPVTDNGIIKTRNHIQWLEARECIERDAYGSVNTTVSGGAIVECPGINDVLFNRGKSCQYHPGNVTFRNKLESKKEEHLIANQTMKKEIAWEIMKDVENRIGRFLHWDKPGWWVEFENRTEIRHKIATSLRDFNKHTRAAKNRQNTHSSTNVFRNQESKKRKLDNSGSIGPSSDCKCMLTS